LIDKIDLSDNPLGADEAIAILRDMQKAFETAARALPQYAVDHNNWDGLVFSVGGVSVTAAMDEVSEMLPMQDRITRVPGSRDWMLGLANVRGSLLPVIDLQQFLGGRSINVSKATRILVIRLQDLVAGLMVPSVQGMRHFHVDDRVTDVRMKGALGAYVYEAFKVDGEIWPVISLGALVADPAFRSAAI
jgi:twitching motility protein PilI